MLRAEGGKRQEADLTDDATSSLLACADETGRLEAVMEGGARRGSRPTSR